MRWFLAAIFLVTALFSAIIPQPPDAAQATSGVVSTVAGNGTAGFAGDGSAATSAQLNFPYGVAVAANGDMYIADNGNARIRKVTGGVISTFAGNGGFGYSGDGGQATAAQIGAPTDVVFDAAGNVYFADQLRCVVRKVSVSGIISTVAGTGTCGFSGDGSAATAAQLDNPTGIAVTLTGAVYVADQSNCRIRYVTTGGIIATVAGNGGCGFSGDGGDATQAELTPFDVSLDAEENYYIADHFNCRVRKVGSNNIVTTVAGTGTCGFAGDGGPAALASLSHPEKVEVAANGDVYIADTFNCRVRRIHIGVISTVAGIGDWYLQNCGFTGDGGQGDAAKVDYPTGMAFHADELYFADSGNERIRKVSVGPAAGYIYDAHIWRDPNTSYESRVAEDRIIFLQDEYAFQRIRVVGAPEGSKWTFRFEVPGVLPCWFKLAAAADPLNRWAVPALIHNCTSTGYIDLSQSFASGCPCEINGFFGGHAKIHGNALAAVGTWGTHVDYTDPLGSTTTDLYISDFTVQPTPNVLVLHGWESDCTAVGGDYGEGELIPLLLDELAIDPYRIACFGYDSRQGVEAAACAIRGRLNELFKPAFESLAPELDIVAHSMGGLVTRYYAEGHCGPDGDPTWPVGSISMLGTPNLGVRIAELEGWLCPDNAVLAFALQNVCFAYDWASELATDLGAPDLHSDAVTDLAPGSDLLDDVLNDGFTVPSSTIYRTHAGRVDTPVGRWTSGEQENDCFVGQESVAGPDGIFGPDELRLIQYKFLSHANFGFGCGIATLTNDAGLVTNVAATIKGVTGGGGGGGGGGLGPEGPAASSSPSLMTSIQGNVMPLASDAHNIAVPANTTGGTFAVNWLTEETPPNITITLRRPNATVVSQTDGDVLGTLDIGETGAHYVLTKGFEMDAPAAGIWQVTVTGTSVPTEGQPYLVMFQPDSNVTVAVDTADGFIPEGQPAIIRASLFDGGAAITALSFSAEVFVPDGTSQLITLHDDGLTGDTVPGDKIYSATFSGTAECATYRIRANATGSSSEGTVTRQALSSFEVHIAEDTIRDPCDADEDNDGLTDEDEQITNGTNPMDNDTDEDGRADNVEIVAGTDPNDSDSDDDALNDGGEFTAGSDPLDPDTDNDTMPDGYEVSNTCLLVLSADATSDTDADAVQASAERAQGTTPCIGDTDGDGFKDRIPTVHAGPANGNVAFDNCILEPNVTQLNSDGNFIDQTPPHSVDDLTGIRTDGLGDACDTDDDNDGLSDEFENIGPCVSATGPSLPAAADSDGDRVLDGSECALSTDPMSAASKPTLAACGVTTDTDGDKINDRTEYCFYGSSISDVDTDGDSANDGAKDGCEIASLNPDRVVSSIDQAILASVISGSKPYTVNVDLNKDGVASSIDQGIMAGFIIPSGQCP